MKNWFVNNFWIKVISLMLAIVTWFYVKGELGKEKQLSGRFYNVEQSDYFRRLPAMKIKDKDSGQDKL